MAATKQGGRRDVQLQPQRHGRSVHSHPVELLLLLLPHALPRLLHLHQPRPRRLLQDLHRHVRRGPVLPIVHGQLRAARGGDPCGEAKRCPCSYFQACL